MPWARVGWRCGSNRDRFGFSQWTDHAGASLTHWPCAPQPRVAADAARAANWLLLNDLGPQVRQGCPDWLFLAEELAPHEGAAGNMAQRAAMVAQVHRALQRDGIRLLVAVVPDKSRIARNHPAWPPTQHRLARAGGCADCFATGQWRAGARPRCRAGGDANPWRRGVLSHRYPLDGRTVRSMRRRRWRGRHKRPVGARSPSGI